MTKDFIKKLFPNSDHTKILLYKEEEVSVLPEDIRNPQYEDEFIYKEYKKYKISMNDYPSTDTARRGQDLYYMTAEDEMGY
jgi:hypothetical protein